MYFSLLICNTCKRQVLRSVAHNGLCSSKHWRADLRVQGTLAEECRIESFQHNKHHNDDEQKHEWGFHTVDKSPNKADLLHWFFIYYNNLIN